jgi:lipoprotein-releasing system permease protein
MKHTHNISSEISLTYIVSNKKLTLIAALGVMIGLAVFIFMNSLMKGFDRISNESIFKTVPHIRIYKEEETSKPLLYRNNTIPVIINPKIVPENKTLVNPNGIIETLKVQENVSIVTPQVNVNVFFNNGKSQISGLSTGVYIDEADKMFSIGSTIVEGNLQDLKASQNGILLGVGIAEKMNVKPGDNISITSSRNIKKIMRVVALFKTNNSVIDKTKSYININIAQQLLSESANFITDINVNIKNFDESPAYAEKFSAITGYKAEDWKAANETLVAAGRMRKIMVTAVSMSILLVAGFGIYNILNMTITQKINDIAILKAMGFKGHDVVKIFVKQALIIGFIGVVMGVLMATFLVNRLSHVYIGGDIGFFPITYEATMYFRGIVFGFIITFLAGYIPARKAADVDPVEIFRK